MTPARRWILSGTLSKTWWLLALCGILDATHASINLLMMKLPLTYRIFGSNSNAVRDMGLLALAAGACAIAAGLWSVEKDHSWLLSLHGLALGAFGLIVVSPLVKGPLSFRPISLLFTVMAASIGAFALETARTQRRGSRGRWFLIAAGAASISFAFSFLGVGFFLRLEPQVFFIWMSSYFVFCAVFMLWLAFRVHGPANGRSDQMESFPPLPSPRHAH
jgi:uncharacterized membrane protein HdeD (DUF308 family)